MRDMLAADVGEEHVAGLQRHHLLAAIDAVMHVHAAVQHRENLLAC
jgi:hypothetical protein